MECRGVEWTGEECIWSVCAGGECVYKDGMYRGVFRKSMQGVSVLGENVPGGRVQSRSVQEEGARREYSGKNIYKEAMQEGSVHRLIHDKGFTGRTNTGKECTGEGEKEGILRGGAY